MTGSSKAYDGRAIAMLLVLLMAFSILPINNVGAEDTGDLFHLQAQDIQASFDSSTELTTITWRNIDSLEQPSALDDFYNAEYHIYRHTEIISQSNIQNATLVHSVSACDSNEYAVKYLCLGGDNGSNLGHSYSYLVAPGTNDSFYYGITKSRWYCNYPWHIDIQWLSNLWPNCRNNNSCQDTLQFNGII